MEQAASHGEGGAGISGEPWNEWSARSRWQHAATYSTTWPASGSSYVRNLEAFPRPVQQDLGRLSRRPVDRRSCRCLP